MDFMTSGGTRAETVGYNVQATVDMKRHRFVEHDVTNVGSGQGRLGRVTVAAK
jgi:hypothetical protein